jgi:hypothetical protein
MTRRPIWRLTFEVVGAAPPGSAAGAAWLQPQPGESTGATATDGAGDAIKKAARSARVARL